MLGPPPHGGGRLRARGTLRWRARCTPPVLTPAPPAQPAPQTAIQADGFRSLRDGEPVEFFIETGDDGRQKAVQVSGPNGANVEVRRGRGGAGRGGARLAVRSQRVALCPGGGFGGLVPRAARAALRASLLQAC